jgi:hypothetical protein
MDAGQVTRGACAPAGPGDAPHGDVDGTIRPWLVGWLPGGKGLAL